MKPTIYLSFVLTAVIFVYSCDNVIKNKEITKKDSLNGSSDRRQYISDITNDIDTLRNIEIIGYCILFPLNEYQEIYPESNEKAWHTFIHKTKKQNEIYLKGLLRSDTSISLDDYFTNTYELAEEQGKIVLEKGILHENHCFYAKGYMSNFIYDYRFIEVYWLRKEDVVIFEASFDVKDTVLWNNRLQLLMAQSSFCN